LPVQPPWYISRMMEPLSHYHCEIYCCKPVSINQDQKTYTNNLNHASTMHQPVPQLVIKLYHKEVHQPCTNLYHKQVHQPCTKPIRITCHNNLSQQPVSSILSTKLDLLTNINHQDNSQRCASTNHNTTTHNHHQDQYVLLITYQHKYVTSSINHVSRILLTSASNHVPSMYQSCIKYSSTMTHQDVPTSSTIHLMYVPTHQLLVSTMYPTCTSTKSPHQFHHPNIICNSIIDLVCMITYL
jgi:hypothetical protein